MAQTEQKQKVKKPSNLWKYERIKLEGKNNEVVYLNLFYNPRELHIFSDSGIELNSDSIQP